MNKYQDTLNWLRETTISLKHNQAYNILQELVDKATPKKPTIITMGSEDMLAGVCKCLESLKYEYKGKKNIYCNFCGQKIDWSDEQ